MPTLRQKPEGDNRHYAGGNKDDGVGKWPVVNPHVQKRLGKHDWYVIWLVALSSILLCASEAAQTPSQALASASSWQQLSDRDLRICSSYLLASWAGLTLLTPSQVYTNATTWQALDDHSLLVIQTYLLSQGSALPNITNFTTYAVGTPYTLTATATALTFGTAQPVLMINQGGTYRIDSQAHIFFVGTTYAATNQVALKLRRTNNTASDLSNATILIPTAVITTLTGDGGNVALPPVIYAATSGDAVTIFGNVRSLPDAGTVQVDSASAIATRLY